MRSSSHSSFTAPQKLSRPNWRTRQGSMQFDPDRSYENPRAVAKASGYVQNSTLFDGTGWVPEKNLHSDMMRTEYRNRFNQAKPFHKHEVRANDGRLKRREHVYDKLSA